MVSEVKDRKAWRSEYVKHGTPVDKRIYRAGKPYFQKKYVYGRNLKETEVIVHNDAVDGMLAAADVIKYLTSCKDNGVLDRKQKRVVNKLLHTKSLKKPGKLRPETIQRWRGERLPAIRKQYEEERKPITNFDTPIGNTKLGTGWTYISFETGLECCAFDCGCHEICYARHMETGPRGPGIIKRIWRQREQFDTLPIDQIAKDIAAFIKKGNNGIRACDSGGIPSQAVLDRFNDIVDRTAAILIEDGIDPTGRFYIYTTRHDLEWDHISKWLVVNASNQGMYDKLPRSNFFREYVEGVTEEDDERLFCSCSCAMCDYCSTEHGEIVDRLSH